jgi:hypothetical protein
LRYNPSSTAQCENFVASTDAGAVGANVDFPRYKIAWAGCRPSGRTTRPTLKSGKAVGRVLEEVGGALVGIAVNDGVRRTDEDGSTAQGQSGTEKVVSCSVTRYEGVEQGPLGTLLPEDVDFALRGVAINCGDIGRDDGFAPMQSQGVAKVEAATLAKALSMVIGRVTESRARFRWFGPARCGVVQCGV